MSRENVLAFKTLLTSAINVTEGEFWECGVYQGGSASLMHSMIPTDRKIRLFDSFEGLPEACEHDNYHKRGDFNDVNLQTIMTYFSDKPNVEIRKGWIPDTFAGLEDCSITFCHLDLDLYEGYVATLNFVWPRLVKGGIIVFDDYQAPSCLGARLAVDQFIAANNIQLQTELINFPHAAWIIKN